MKNLDLESGQLKPQLISVTHCDEKSLRHIKSRLDEFYRTVSDYSAFSTPSDQINCWTHIAEHIRKLSATGKVVTILEVGAGRSGFGNFISAQGLRKFCIWTAQDVTRQNSEWLEKNADKVVFGDIESASIDVTYDIVFSTFVLEHVVNPLAHLDRLASLVQPSHGTIFIFSPRYDFPGYLSPSSRHLAKGIRFKFMLFSSMARIKTIFTKQPAFLIQTDLAAFHQPFFTDADAVHWVSLYDLKSWARSKRAIFNTLKIGSPRFLSKDWIVKRFLTNGIAIQFDA
ncbi:MAG TPA: methyltransferase domain-containing protein [Gallionella sp.]|nr:methyltransferase domain-containing protein [Gallionella sp.]